MTNPDTLSALTDEQCDAIFAACETEWNNLPNEEATPLRLDRALIRAGFAAGAAANKRDVLTDAARDVLAERERQITAEGWTLEHDSEQHGHGQMQIAAACLCVKGTDAEVMVEDEPADWWGLASKHAGNEKQRKRLVIAAALLLAEIERIDRAALDAAQSGEGK